ncbi:alpha/beta hydrolase [Kribbella sp. NPDC054772]
MHDVQSALRWLRRNPLGLPIDQDHIGIWGHSAGGHLAAVASLNPNRTARRAQAAATRSGTNETT